MREEGTIVAIEGRTARVRMKPSAECGSCCACSAFGSGRELEIETDHSLHVGARVTVEIAAGNPWLSSFLLFVLPLLGLLVGVIVGAQWRPFGVSGDTAALVLGFGLLAALFAFAALIDKHVVRKHLKPPTIVEVLGPQP